MTQPIRVLHVASGDLWAGAEVQVFTLVSHLAQMPGVIVGAALMNEGVLAERLRDIGVWVEILDETRHGVFALIANLRRTLRDWRPDVVHTHREKENIVGTIANRLWRNVPCVRTVHGQGEQIPGSLARRAKRATISVIDQWCGRNLQDRVISVSQELQLTLETRFAPTQVRVIENGVDIEKVRSEKELAKFRLVSPRAIHVGIVGRLVPVKRVDLFIDAASILVRELRDTTWKFHVFGNGPLRVDLERRAEQLEISENVQFHGHCTDIATCIGGLDLLVNCSDHEGLPMTVLEAMALDIPVVAHAVGGLQSAVPPECLVFDHNSRGYRNAIARVILEGDRSSPHVARNIEKYSATRNASQMRAVYQEILVERRSGAGRT